MSPRSADKIRLVMTPRDRRLRWVLTGRTPVKPARGHGWPLQACPNRYQETRIRTSRRKGGSEGARPLQKNKGPAAAKKVSLPKAAIPNKGIGIRRQPKKPPCRRQLPPTKDIGTRRQPKKNPHRRWLQLYNARPKTKTTGSSHVDRHAGSKPYPS